jgi:DNA-binding SARP family transcriptional activator/tetratricopeptide (TPR) repeat protein
VAGETEFCLLGPLAVRARGEQLPIPPGQQRVLLAALLLAAGRPVSTDELTDLLWGDAPPPSSRLSLQNCVMRLRRSLRDSAAAIRTEPGGYRIQTGPDALDITRFEAALAAGRTAARAGAWADASRRLAGGLALWRGAPLADVPSDVLAARERPRLAELRLQALETRIGADLRLGRAPDVIAELRQLVAREPLRERLHGLLMTALYQDGQPAAALAAYQDASEILVEELGAEPGPELRRLHRQVRDGDPALAAPPPPARDQAAEEQRAGDPAPGQQRAGAQPAGGQPAGGQPAGEQAAPAPAGAPLEVRYGLPPDTVAFTGRDRELDQITDGLAGGGVVAIDGMPGIGKTALAVHAAARLASRFPDRQLFVDLRGHTPGRAPLDPAEALAGLLAATGVDPRSMPPDLDGRAARWRDTMAGQRALLVLDNAASSEQVAPLLPGAGSLVLVTSRRHLADLPGVVAPVLLEVLPPARAREMFTALAPRAAGPAAARPVAEVVALAGFLPLAISLLARLYNRHHAWSLADLTAETRASLLTLAAERDSVAAAFELSWRHLDPGQQDFFRCLSLHPGTTADAYAAAALAGVPLAAAARLLDGLHGEGLLTETGHRRYGQHDLIRRYVTDRAAADPPAARAAATGRLLDYYQHTAALAEARLGRHAHGSAAPVRAAPPAAVPDLPDAARALAWARAERASLLAGIDHAAAAGDEARVVGLTAAVASLLRHDGPWSEAITRHEAAAAAAGHLGDRAGQARALNEIGVLRKVSGDGPGAAQILEQALGIFRELGDRAGQAHALSYLADVWRLSGDFADAARALGEALDSYRALGNERGQANALVDLGSIRIATGDYPAAAADFADALVIYRKLGNRLGQANALMELGLARRLTGDYPAAAGLIVEGLGLYREFDNRLGQASALGLLGSIRRLTGDFPAAALALTEALALADDIGSQVTRANALFELGILRRVTGDFPAAGAALADALGIFRRVGARDGEAGALNETGALELARGAAGRAADHYREALSVAWAIDSPQEEATALAGLGRCAAAGGDLRAAVTQLTQAQAIFGRLGAAEAAGVAAELGALAEVARPRAARDAAGAS